MVPVIVQFFLGDFRPLARDTHGNVLDVVSNQMSPSYLEDCLFNHNIFLLGIIGRSSIISSTKDLYKVYLGVTLLGCTLADVF